MLTTVEFGIFTEPDNSCFRFGMVNYTFEFYHFIFSNTESGTGLDTFNLDPGWRHWKKQDKSMIKVHFLEEKNITFVVQFVALLSFS